MSHHPSVHLCIINAAFVDHRRNKTVKSKILPATVAALALLLQPFLQLFLQPSLSIGHLFRTLAFMTTVMP